MADTVRVGSGAYVVGSVPGQLARRLPVLQQVSMASGAISNGIDRVEFVLGGVGLARAALAPRCTSDAVPGTGLIAGQRPGFSGMLIQMGLESGMLEPDVGDDGQWMGMGPPPVRVKNEVLLAIAAVLALDAANSLLADEPEGPVRTLNDPLPRSPRRPSTADPHAPDPAAAGTPHTVIGTRTDPKKSPAPYRQGITYDEHGNPVGRTDVTDHGRRDHTKPHWHPYDPAKDDFGPQQPMPR